MSVLVVTEGKSAWPDERPAPRRLAWWFDAGFGLLAAGVLVAADATRDWLPFGVRWNIDEHALAVALGLNAVLLLAVVVAPWLAPGSGRRLTGSAPPALAGLTTGAVVAVAFGGPLGGLGATVVGCGAAGCVASLLADGGRAARLRAGGLALAVLLLVVLLERTASGLDPRVHHTDSIAIAVFFASLLLLLPALELAVLAPRARCSGPLQVAAAVGLTVHVTTTLVGVAQVNGVARCGPRCLITTLQGYDASGPVHWASTWAVALVVVSAAALVRGGGSRHRLALGIVLVLVVPILVRLGTDRLSASIWLAGLGATILVLAVVGSRVSGWRTPPGA